MQKMQNFSGEGAQSPSQTPPQWGGGHPLLTPHSLGAEPRRLDLNPSHFEILPTLLVKSLLLFLHCAMYTCHVVPSLSAMLF